MAGRTDEVILAEIDPQVRTSYGELVRVLRDADDAEFTRIRTAAQAMTQQFGPKHGGTRYARACRHLALIVKNTRDQWS